MLPARKDEGFHVEDGVKKDDGPIERRIEVWLLRLEDKVTVIATDLKELKSEVKSLGKDISDAKIWALIIAAGVLGILAKGFHWI
jgi:hypothetical protein